MDVRAPRVHLTCVIRKRASYKQSVAPITGERLELETCCAATSVAPCVAGRTSSYTHMWQVKIRTEKTSSPFVEAAVTQELSDTHTRFYPPQWYARSGRYVDWFLHSRRYPGPVAPPWRMVRRGELEGASFLSCSSHVGWAWSRVPRGAGQAYG